jgi:hypothetical protein
MEEMQSQLYCRLVDCVVFNMSFVSRNDVFHRQWPGWSGQSGRSCRTGRWWWNAGDGRYVQDDGSGRSCKPRPMRYHQGHTIVEPLQ